VTQLYDLALAETGLRAAQFSILAKLRRGGPMTMSQLAAALVVDRTTLTRNLAPLEREGLVSVAPGEVDRRSKALDLTRLGRRRLAGADAAWDTAQARFEAALGGGRSAELRALLGAVVAGVGAELGGADGDE